VAHDFRAQRGGGIDVEAEFLRFLLYVVGQQVRAYRIRDYVQPDPLTVFP
jgi:hypothetical protein